MFELTRALETYLKAGPARAILVSGFMQACTHPSLVSDKAALAGDERDQLLRLMVELKMLADADREYLGKMRDDLAAASPRDVDAVLYQDELRRTIDPDKRAVLAEFLAQMPDQSGTC